MNTTEAEPVDEPVVEKPKRKRSVKTLFVPGNKVAVGNRGPRSPDIVTQELISQLHEMDKSTKKEKKHKLVAQLIKIALGYTYTRKEMTKDGEVVEFEDEMHPNITAIREVFDRVEGKARQSLILSGDANNPLRVISDDAESFTRSIIEANAGDGTAENPFRNENDDEGRPEVALAVLGKT